MGGNRYPDSLPDMGVCGGDGGCGCAVDAGAVPACVREAAHVERGALGRGMVEGVRAMAAVYEGLTGHACEVGGVGLVIKQDHGKVTPPLPHPHPHNDPDPDLLASALWREKSWGA